MAYAIVFARKSKMLRRVIADDDGDVVIGTMPDGTSQAVICNHPGQPSSYHPLHPNEDAAIVTVPEGSVHAPEDWHQAVHDHTGSAPEAIRCAMIDNITGEVIAEVIADPDIDVAPDGCRLEIR